MSGQKNLTITVSGEAGSGKSRLAYLIKEFLLTQGLQVVHTTDPDYLSDEHRVESLRRNLAEAINGFAETKIITINEVNVIEQNNVS